MYAIGRCINFKTATKIEQFGRLSSIDTNKTYYTYSPEPSQPLNREPTFCSVEDAVKCVKSGKLIEDYIEIIVKKSV